MRTVKDLKEELSKFPDDAMCWAYEGESIGIRVSKEGKDGFIHCADSAKEDFDTNLFDPEREEQP